MRNTQVKPRLLNLGFLELDVLAHDRVILAELELFSGLTRILFRHVKKAGASGAEQLDEDGGGLSHFKKTPNAWFNYRGRKIQFAAAVSRPEVPKSAKKVDRHNDQGDSPERWAGMTAAAVAGAEVTARARA